MGLLLTGTAGLCVWIVLWSFGIKGFDSFLITVLMVLTAIVLRNLLPFLPGGGRE
jgi:hypothetical protein